MMVNARKVEAAKGKRRAISCLMGVACIMHDFFRESPCVAAPAAIERVNENHSVK